MRASHGLTHKFTGFFITVERDASDGKTLSTATASKSNDDSVGTFHIISHAISKFSDLCPNIVTHTNSLAKSDVPVMIFLIFPLHCRGVCRMSCTPDYRHFVQMRCMNSLCCPFHNSKLLLLHDE